MNQILAETRSQNDIFTKLEKLMEITFSIKFIVYKIANLPLETVKFRSKLTKSSILTSMDSIFFDLKRIETILYKQSDLMKFASLKKSQDSKAFCDSVHTTTKKYRNMLEFETFAFQKEYLTKSNNYGIESEKFQKLSHQAQGFQKELIQKKLLQYASDHDEYNKMSQTLLINNKKNRKKYHQIGISKVSSCQYIESSQNPTVKEHYQNLQKQVHSRQNNSEIGNPKITFQLNKFSIEERQKESDNENFLRQFSKSRQKTLKSIQKKKMKCLKTINNIKCSFLENKCKKYTEIDKKQKIKSKTEKFYPEQYSRLCQIAINLTSSEQFVGI